MKFFQLALVCVLVSSWNVVCAMESQVEESQEIAIARAKTLLELGKMLVERKDYEKAREYLEEAATQGTDKASAVAARVKLGELYYGGLGVEIDYEKAYECFMQAANQKEDLQALVVACLHLGEMYFLGRGVVQDYKKAGVYFQLLNNPEIKEAGSVLSVTLVQWRLIEPQLERVLYAITDDKINAVQLRKEIAAEYGKLDAKSLIQLIHVLDYAGIPLLCEIACDVVKKSNLGSFNFEQINSLPGDMGNRIILDKILASYGPMPASELAVGRGHEGLVYSVCVTDDGKIVSCSSDRTVRVWDNEGKELAVCRGHEGPIYSVCVTQDGKIVLGPADQTVRVWDMHGNQLAICRGHENLVWSVCVMQDGKIVSGSADKTIRVWDMQGNQLAICMGHEDRVCSLCVTQDGKIVSGSWDKTIRVWDREGKELAICRARTTVYSVCVTADGKIVSGSKDGGVRVWDMQGNQLAKCGSHERVVYSVSPMREGKIVSGSYDKTIRVWDMQGKELAVCTGHEKSVLSVWVTNDGNIVSGSDDKTVRVWDIGLLGRIARMDEDQARALWELLHKVSKRAEIGKQELWKEIAKILGGAVQVEHAIVNNNNE